MLLGGTKAHAALSKRKTLIAFRFALFAMGKLSFPRTLRWNTHTIE
jgi:hypothetical protein